MFPTAFCGRLCFCQHTQAFIIEEFPVSGQTNTNFTALWRIGFPLIPAQESLFTKKLIYQANPKNRTGFVRQKLCANIRIKIKKGKPPWSSPVLFQKAKTLYTSSPKTEKKEASSTP